MSELFALESLGAGAAAILAGIKAQHGEDVDVSRVVVLIDSNGRVEQSMHFVSRSARDDYLRNAAGGSASSAINVSNSNESSPFPRRKTRSPIGMDRPFAVNNDVSGVHLSNLSGQSISSESGADESSEDGSPDGSDTVRIRSAGRSLRPRLVSQSLAGRINETAEMFPAITLRLLRVLMSDPPSFDGLRQAVAAMARRGELAVHRPAVFGAELWVVAQGTLEFVYAELAGDPTWSALVCRLFESNPADPAVLALVSVLESRQQQESAEKQAVESVAQQVAVVNDRDPQEGVDI